MIRFPSSPFPLGGNPFSSADTKVTGLRTNAQQGSQLQASQLNRIEKGISSGALSQTEADKLLRQQANVADLIARAEADGKVTGSEQRAINKALRQAERSITRSESNFERGNPLANPLATHRQLNQLNRIEQGVKSGSLSGTETAGLLREQAGIARSLGGAQRDGSVNPFEALGIQAQQNAASGNIWSQKHDGQQAAWKGPSLPTTPRPDPFQNLLGGLVNQLQSQIQQQLNNLVNNLLGGGNSPFGGGSPFGGASPFGGGSPFGGASPFGGGSPFGGASPFGGGSPFGGASPFGGGSPFGGASPFGGGSPFGGFPSFPVGGNPFSSADAPVTGKRTNVQQAAQLQGSQLNRIEKGLANGSISQAEADKLLAQQANVSDLIARAEADGKVSKKERRAINKALRAAEQAIGKAEGNAERGNPLADPLATLRQLNQINRIEQGVKSGSLSNKETAGLLREQANIARTLGNAQADGRVNVFESFNVQAQQTAASGNIWSQKHDLDQASWSPRFPLGGF